LAALNRNRKPELSCAFQPLLCSHLAFFALKRIELLADDVVECPFLIGSADFGGHVTRP
jgi:hypothetical protein